MKPVALLRNTNATLNRAEGGTGALPRELANDADLLRADVTAPADFTAAVRTFERAGVGLVVVDGGDGTIHQVLSALDFAPRTQVPDLAILPSGNTNLIAHDVGARGRDAATLARLIADWRGGRPTVIERRVLRINFADAEHPPLRGMLFGLGAFTEGVRFAQHGAQPKGINHGPAVAAGLAAVVIRTLFGADTNVLRRGLHATLAVDGTEAPSWRRFLVLATTLDSLVLGIWPFWGGSGGDRIRWLDIAAPPRRLYRALVPLLRGRPTKWMIEDGYRSGGASRLGLTLDAPFVIDGETFEPGPAGRIELTADETARFIVR